MPLGVDSELFELIAVGLSLLMTIIALFRGNSSQGPSTNKFLIITALASVLLGTGSLAQQTYYSPHTTEGVRQLYRQLDEEERLARLGRQAEFDQHVTNMIAENQAEIRRRNQEMGYEPPLLRVRPENDGRPIKYFGDR